MPRPRRTSRGRLRILSDAQLIEMAELREQGLSIQAITDHFNAAGIRISRGAIGWQCLRLGADVPVEQRKAAYQNVAVMMRGGHVVRRFTEQEDADLLRLEGTGMAIADIAEAIGRKENSVRARLLTLARHDARQEEAA